MADNTGKAEFTPEIASAFNERLAPVIAEANKRGQYKVVYGMLVAMLAMFDMPEDAAADMLIAAGMSTSAEIKAHLNGMGSILNTAGFSNDELRAVDAQYHETMRQLKEGANNHGNTH